MQEKIATRIWYNLTISVILLFTGAFLGENLLIGMGLGAFYSLIIRPFDKENDTMNIDLINSKALYKDLDTQFDKIVEEFEEVKQEVRMNKILREDQEDFLNENLLDELFDLIQASYTMMNALYTPKKINIVNDIHNMKIINKLEELKK